MYLKVLLNLFLISILAIFQIAFVEALPSPFNGLNLIIVIILFVLGIFGLDYALWWALGTGLLMDVFSFSFFGSHIISLFFAVFIVDFLLKNFLTDRSLYVFLISVVIISLSYELFFNFSLFLFNFFTNSNTNIFSATNFFRAEVSQLFLNIISVFVIFYIFSFVSDKLSPVFLAKNKK